ncbi:hypothetical protein ACFQS3_11490 [Glycomyces mayteni]|uniref:Uncharacterized protein n=1 Tax=Glycomyces mayteni TaxID=543887 RepID=A0ABW2D6K9_9ACTN|nr:hypothetical protein GCM10025732_33450 [Glycomyces mayteni]
MSLLSNLIAELSALVERSRESRANLKGAADQLGRVYEKTRATTVGSASEQVTEGLGQLHGGIGKIEEAQRLLSAGDGKWQSYLAVLTSASGGGTVPSPRARPPLSGSGNGVPIRKPTHDEIRPPLPRRHRLARIDRKSRIRPDNTVILPGVDVEGDLDAIRTGKASWNDKTGRYELNGRIWGVHGNGTVFPVSGTGFEQLTREQFKALTELISADRPVGVWPRSHLKNPHISKSDWDRAAEVYQYHPRHNRGAP